MSRVEEIKAAIDQLSPEERCELAALLNPMEEDDWDRQMKKDAEPGGKLDRIKEAANKEYKQGKSLPFPKPAGGVADGASLGRSRSLHAH